VQQQQQQQQQLPTAAASTEESLLNATRQLSIQNNKHLGLDDAKTRVKGFVVICSLLTTFDAKAHRFLQSIEKFETDTTVFASCDEATCYLLPRIFPGIRFVLFPDLHVQNDHGPAEAVLRLAVAKANLVRRALLFQAVGAWYLDPDLVLFAKLPTVSKGVQVALSHGSSHTHHGEQSSHTGMVYFSSESAARAWAQDIPKFGSGEKALQNWQSKGLEAGFQELDCGHNFDLGDDHGDGDEGVSTASLICSGGILKSADCTISSAHLPDQSPTTIITLRGILTPCGHSAVTLFDHVPGEPSKSGVSPGPNHQLRRLGKKHEEEKKEEKPARVYWTSPTPVPWWYNIEELPPEERVMVHQHRILSLKDPAANVINKTVICIVFDSFKDEVRRFIAGIRLFQGDMAVFISTTQDNVERLVSNYPAVRFALVSRLDRYRDPTSGKWLGRWVMAKSELWFEFNAERPNLMKLALESGARAAWYMDTDINLIRPLPYMNSSVEVGLTPHYIGKHIEHNAGHFNSGMTYFANLTAAEKWLGARKKKRGSITQDVLNKFTGQPGMYELGCSNNVGWYQMEKGMNREREQLYYKVACTGGEITFKLCPVNSIHVHIEEEQGWRMMTHLGPALEQCHSRAMPIFHQAAWEEKQWEQPVVYWGGSFLTIEPGANVLDNVVVCLMADGLGPQLKKMLAALQKFEPALPVFISGTEELSRTLPNLYPSMRLRIFKRLGKSDAEKEQRVQDAKGHQLAGRKGEPDWQYRFSKVALKGVRAFHEQKGWLLRSAIWAGASGTWFLDAEKVLDAPLKRFPAEENVEFVESFDGVPEHANIRGNAYFSRVIELNRWLDRVAPNVTAMEHPPKEEPSLDQLPFSDIRAIFHRDI